MFPFTGAYSPKRPSSAPTYSMGRASRWSTELGLATPGPTDYDLPGSPSRPLTIPKARRFLDWTATDTPGPGTYQYVVSPWCLVVRPVYFWGGGR